MDEYVYIASIEAVSLILFLDPTTSPCSYESQI